MDAFFDNKTNLVSARICAALDDAPLYTVATAHATFRGRVRTVLRDANPLPGAPRDAIVGAINWAERSVEVRGVRRACKDVRRSESNGIFGKKTRYWRWGPGRKEYELTYTHEEWKAMLPPDTADVPADADRTPDTPDKSAKPETDESKQDPALAARLAVPFRPHLFTKSPPPALHLTPAALVDDEVFLILVLIYEEVRRQDKTNTSLPE
ncbi:hypothetical protein B0H15DRAFT_886050 [Mycena belliarum]|uniref:Uncharacterized protein n=1 Tax=Mycena belliarum TaxID=1033014 RepID=A0AAD6U853_9AGAR|nr:hypothetical protein B0H15DRAFT_886050 [Mycena belliae]